MEENFYDDYDYEDMAADIRSINASRAGSVNSATIEEPEMICDECWREDCECRFCRICDKALSKEESDAHWECIREN